MIAPEIIGRYSVERLLGQGGMGRVWLARDTVLGRRVAIKVLRDDLALPPTVRDELLARMRHEARAAAAVSHPNIVTLHDMGEDGGAAPSSPSRISSRPPRVGLYLVFEYVAGPRADGPETLRERLREGPLPLPEVAKLARELGSALTFAHAAGVIHRDIKPENILFSRTGAKIADFGIARIPESTITRVNTVLGTPAYTSPEALSKADFGPASDQFAFAATLYEAASGVRAFGGDDPIVTAGKVSTEAPPPLDGTLGPATTMRSLGAALAKGLAKDVGDRFASCVDLGEAVARAIERGEGPALEGATTSAATLFDGSLPEPELIELERTPLSSRVVLEKAAARRNSDRPMMTPLGATPARPSIIIRRQTHKVQNIIAAVSLIVLVVLVLLGKKQSDAQKDAAKDPAKAATSAASSANAPAHHSGANGKRVPTKPERSAASSVAAPSSAASTSPMVPSAPTPTPTGDESDASPSSIAPKPNDP